MADKRAIVITGTRQEPGDAIRIIMLQLLSFNPAKVKFIVGGASGVDITFAMLARALDFEVFVVLPNAPFDERADEYCTGFEQLTTTGPVSKRYLARNTRMLELCTGHVLAFPKSNKEELRSGTWATIRRARKLDLPVDIHPLWNTK